MVSNKWWVASIIAYHSDDTFVGCQVAINAGLVCGASGASSCAPSDVTLTVATRRAVLVTYSLQTYTDSSATAAVSTLNTYMASSQFVTALNTNNIAVSTATISSSSIGSTPGTGSPAPAPAPSDDSSSGGIATWKLACSIPLIFIYVVGMTTTAVLWARAPPLVVPAQESEQARLNCKETK